MANIQVNKDAHPFDKTRLEALLNRRFFYAPAFEIYGGEFSSYSIWTTPCVPKLRIAPKHKAVSTRGGWSSESDRGRCSCITPSVSIG